MGIRQRKNNLILALKGYAFGGKLSKEQVEKFELRYRQARTEQDQNAVTADLHKTLTGWMTGGDAYSRLLRNASDLGDDFEEDDDPPALKEALARSQITFQRGRS
jgi:hypothetical protein